MQPGYCLGRYEIQSLLARGGMAEVWLAVSKGAGGFQKRVVVKTILPYLAENSDFVRMFVNEALLAARLNHHNIVQIFDLGHVDGRYFIAMEYVPGRTLRQISRACRLKDQLIPAWFVLRVIAAVCEGLQFAHDYRDEQGNPLGLVHRDVTPENIMVSFTGTVKILDFGVAKATTVASQTQAGTIKGKYAYLSPEQAHGAPADRRTDIYAVGVILYELLTGVRPFWGDNDLALLRRVAEGNPTPPRTIAPWISKDLEHVVLTALARDPGQRYAECGRLEEDLRAILEKEQDVHGQRDLAMMICSLFPDEPAVPTDVLKRLSSAGDRALDFSGVSRSHGAKPTAPQKEPVPIPVISQSDPLFADMIADKQTIKDLVPPIAEESNENGAAGLGPDLQQELPATISSRAVDSAVAASDRPPSGGAAQPAKAAVPASTTLPGVARPPTAPGAAGPTISAAAGPRPHEVPGSMTLPLAASVATVSVAPPISLAIASSPLPVAPALEPPGPATPDASQPIAAAQTAETPPPAAVPLESPAVETRAPETAAAEAAPTPEPLPLAASKGIPAMPLLAKPRTAAPKTDPGAVRSDADAGKPEQIPASTPAPETAVSPVPQLALKPLSSAPALARPRTTPAKAESAPTGFEAPSPAQAPSALGEAGKNLPWPKPLATPMTLARPRTAGAKPEPGPGGAEPDRSSGDTMPADAPAASVTPEPAPGSTEGDSGVPSDSLLPQAAPIPSAVKPRRAPIMARPSTVRGQPPEPAISAGWGLARPRTADRLAEDPERAERADPSEHAALSSPAKSAETVFDASPSNVAASDFSQKQPRPPISAEPDIWPKLSNQAEQDIRAKAAASDAENRLAALWEGRRTAPDAEAPGENALEARPVAAPSASRETDPPLPPLPSSARPITTDEPAAAAPDIFGARRTTPGPADDDVDVFTSFKPILEPAAQSTAETALENKSTTPPTSPWNRPKEPSPLEAARQFEEGLALLRRGDHAAALECWERATSLDPENRVYQSNLRRLQRQVKGTTQG